MSGQTQNIVRDAGNSAAPQAFDATANTYFYLGGDSVRLEGFFRQAPIVPFALGAYTNSAQVKSAAGTYFGASGQYKGAVVAWIMVFDSNGAPSTGATPLDSTSVPPGNGTSGPDVNWSMSPGKPYTCSNGIYIALSSTGGTFTALGNTDLTGKVEYV